MKKTDIVTTTYTYKDGFMIDICEDAKNDIIHVYLYHNEYGVKSLLFGLPISQNIAFGIDTTEKLLDLIENNLINQNFIELYINEFMDGDEYEF